jgi:tetratricopeptide (TPR) repeat protein
MTMLPAPTLVVVMPALAALLAPAASAAPSPADRALGAAEARVARAPERPDAYVALAAAFLQKARETADAAYYTRARPAVDRALALDPGHYGALRTRAWVLVGLHDFRAGLTEARRAQALAPGDWWNYGTIADACLELGDYECAADATERMVSLRPGLPSYTRAAFLRALFGDRPGAIAILRLAAAAAAPDDPESLAWTLVHLGHEHFAGGELAAAAGAYAGALDLLPGYYLALGGLARVRAAEGQYDEAIDLYRRAVERVPAPDLVAALGDVFAAAGEAEEAERQYALVEHVGRVAAATGNPDGRQLALFYADHGRRPQEALRLARAEAATRGGVYADDTLAWALHANALDRAAARAAHRALRIGTPDAMLEYHAGVIAAALGRRARAARHLRRALALNPHFDLRQAPVARAMLAGLEAPVVARREAR